MHTGIGPFDINSGSVMGYGRVNFTRKGLRAAALHAACSTATPTTCSRAIPAGKPIAFAFNTKTYDFDCPTCRPFATRHVVSYGGNLRFNKFDLSLAPHGDNRTEFGVYGQDEIFLSDHFRLIVERAGRSLRLPRRLRVLAAHRRC